VEAGGGLLLRSESFGGSSSDLGALVAASPFGVREDILLAVFRIRIHMFLGRKDPDPLVRGMDPDLIRILLSLSKKSKKNIDFYSFVTSF
jgi:hypothetical protein